jgi:hypothetical protein
MDKHQARTALLAINIALGVLFLLFPKLTLRLYGLDPDRDESAAYPVRYLGARSLLFAALLMDEDGREVLLEQWPVVLAVDSGANVLALVSGEVPKRTALLGGLTTGIAAAIGYLARD